MSRETYVLRGGELVLKELADPIEGTHIIRDQMNETWHPADGKVYDSKSQFRKATKAAGCIEVGDQKGFGGRKSPGPPRLSKEQRCRDIKTAIEQLRSR